MRMAGDVFAEMPGWGSAAGSDSGDRFMPAGGGSSQEGEDLAMTRARALQLLNNLTNEAVKGNITPDAFSEGMFYAGTVGSSADFTRRNIRNVMATPFARDAVENPGLLRGLVKAGVRIPGVNPESLKKYQGLGMDVLQEARKDGLLRPDVSLKRVRDEVQRPMHGALQDWQKTRGKDPRIHQLLKRSNFGDNVGGSARTAADLPQLLIRQGSQF